MKKKKKKSKVGRKLTMHSATFRYIVLLAHIDCTNICQTKLHFSREFSLCFSNAPGQKSKPGPEGQSNKSGLAVSVPNVSVCK